MKSIFAENNKINQKNREKAAVKTPEQTLLNFADKEPIFKEKEPKYKLYDKCKYCGRILENHQQRFIGYHPSCEK